MNPSTISWTHSIDFIHQNRLSNSLLFKWERSMLAADSKIKHNRSAVFESVANKRHVSFVACIELNEFESGQSATHFHTSRFSNARRTGNQHGSTAFSWSFIVRWGGYADERKRERKYCCWNDLRPIVGASCTGFECCFDCLRCLRESEERIWWLEAIHRHDGLWVLVWDGWRVWVQGDWSLDWRNSLLLLVVLFQWLVPSLWVAAFHWEALPLQVAALHWNALSWSMVVPIRNLSNAFSDHSTHSFPLTHSCFELPFLIHRFSLSLISTIPYPPTSSVDFFSLTSSSLETRIFFVLFTLCTSLEEPFFPILLNRNFFAGPSVLDSNSAVTDLGASDTSPFFKSVASSVSTDGRFCALPFFYSVIQPLQYSTKKLRISIVCRNSE